MKPNRLKTLSCVLGLLMLTSSQQVFANPESTNYELREYGFGSGGTDQDGVGSTNYKIHGLTGESDSGNSQSTNFVAGNGYNYTLQAGVPAAPTLSNSNNSYNSLHLVLNPGSAPSDTRFAIAASPDNFSTITKYVQNDNGLGNTLGAEDWQTYSSWGGLSGIIITGLEQGTTYSFKVSAMKGNFTQSGFGTVAQETTAYSSITFDIDVSSSDSESSEPYSLSLGELTAGNITTSTSKIWVDLDTNAMCGGMVYVHGTNQGLLSSSSNNKINSTSSNLVSLDEGYGLRGVSVSEVSGGPMQIVAPYDGAGNSVGIADTSPKIMFDSDSQSVSGGRASFEIQAKASLLTAAGDDYNDTLTVIAAACF